MATNYLSTMNTPTVGVTPTKASQIVQQSVKGVVAPQSVNKPVVAPNKPIVAPTVAPKVNTTPSVSTGNTINSSNIKTTTPITVTQPQPNTQGAMLQSDIISKGQADTARAIAEENRIAAQQGTAQQTVSTPSKAESVIKNILNQNTTPTVDNTMSTTNVNGITAGTVAQEKQGIADAYSNIQGETRLTAQEYAGTVDPAKQELNAINAQVNDEALAGRRRIEAVMTIPGITKEQAQDKINEISRVNTSKLADLSVVQMAKQGQYDSAKEIADRAVQAKVEDQKNKLQALMFTYTENKELFTKAEQRAFETAQADRERKLNAEEKNLQRISDLSLQAQQDGAPTSVVVKMRNAKTEAEAIALGGQYIGALDRAAKKASIAQSQASTAKIYADIAKDRATGQAKKAGVVLTPVSAARIQSEVSSLNNLTTSSGIKGAVGTNVATRRTTGFFGNLGRTLTLGNLQGVKGTVTGETSNFIAGVEQLREQATLDKLIEAKASGATFGALSDGERQSLAAASSRLGTWAIKDDKGQIVAYNTSEKEMKKELDTIKNFKKLDYIYRGGNIADVGVIQTPDGRLATQNSDGTYTILK